MTTVANTKSESQNLVGPIALAVLVVIGVFAWIVQLTQGFEVVGVGKGIVWGIYIAAFFLLLGTGCALVLFTAAGDLGLLPEIQSKRQSLLTFAIGMFVAGGIAILMDIGRPERVFNLLLSPQWKSPFIWDFFSLAITFVVTAVYWFAQPKGRLLPWVAGIMAVLVIIVEGWILGVLASRPIWHGGLMPVTFLLDALIAGCAFLILIVDSQAWARKALIYLLIIAGLVTLVDVTALIFSGPTAAKMAVSLMLSGNLALWFWAQILLGITIPVILLLMASTNRVVTIIAAGLAILGVLLSKLTLLTAGQAIPLLGPAESYTPTLVELGGVLGVLALALLLGYLGLRYTPAKIGKN